MVIETKKAHPIAIIDGMDAPSLPSPRLAVEGRKTCPAGLVYDGAGSCLKNVFQPNICVGSAIQILNILLVCTPRALPAGRLRFETRIRLDLKPESYF